MSRVKLFEEFVEGSQSDGVNTSDSINVSKTEMDKPCVDCDMVTKKIKKEIKRIDKIKCNKKETN